MKALTYAPILYSIYATWLFSNQQVFMNVVPLVEGPYVNPLQGHTFSQLFTQITPGTPFLTYVIISLIVIILGGASYYCRSSKDKTNATDIVILESLDPFFSIVKKMDRAFWF